MNHLMKTTSIPPPAPIFKSTSASGAVPLGLPVISIVSDEEGRRSRDARSFFSAIQAFLSGLVDGCAFQDLSLGREVSIIFTSNGPLIYRWESNNGKSPVRS
jgi:hypothetical protein